MPTTLLPEKTTEVTLSGCPLEATPELVEHDENDAPRHPFLNRTQRVLLLLGGLFVGACLWQAYWHSVPQTGRIADIRVGQRVYSENPIGEEDLQFGRDIDSATWKKITLKANKFDGATADVVLLRPDRWLEDRDAKVGGTIDLYLAEVGIFGPAEVQSIEPCPEIAKGDGQVVTGTFRHQSGDVYDLAIEGEEQPIGTTGNHPFWSVDRQDFIPACQLRPGERLSTPYGVTTVKGLTPRGPPEPVYNLEVAVNHTYHVGETGVLVHNVYHNIPSSRMRSLSRADEFGLRPHSVLKKHTAGKGLHAHHLIEKRFADTLGVKQSSIMSVALTPAEHQVFTNKWRDLIPYGTGTQTATPESIAEAARQIYKEYPEFLIALGL